MRKAVLLATALLTLVLINYLIWDKESILRNGDLVLLPLAPVDPRSLMQGDYMVLSYRMPNTLPSADKAAAKGHLVIDVDEHRVATIKDFYVAGQSIEKSQRLIRYRMREQERFSRRNNISIGADSFFFQEGHRQSFERACFGELRLAASGKSVLVGLRDAERKPIIPKLNDTAPASRLAQNCPAAIN